MPFFGIGADTLKRPIQLSVDERRPLVADVTLLARLLSLAFFFPPSVFPLPDDSECLDGSGEW